MSPQYLTAIGGAVVKSADRAWPAQLDETGFAFSLTLPPSEAMRNLTWEQPVLLRIWATRFAR